VEFYTLYRLGEKYRAVLTARALKTSLILSPIAIGLHYVQCAGFCRHACSHNGRRVTATNGRPIYQLHGGDWKRETWHRETIKIVETGIAIRDIIAGMLARTQGSRTRTKLSRTRTRTWPSVTKTKNQQIKFKDQNQGLSTQPAFIMQQTQIILGDRCG